MAKTIFWRAANIKDNLCAPCPFMGVKVNSFAEFAEKVVKGRLFNYIDREARKGTYPAVVFSTKDRNIDILFSGSRTTLNGAPLNMRTGKPVKWGLYDYKNSEIFAFLDLDKPEDQERLMSYFEDSVEIDSFAEALTTLVKRNGGISFSL